MVRTGHPRQPEVVMKVPVRKYAAVLGGVIVMALFVWAASGLAYQSASAPASIGGHYSLQPVW
jgi:hypothetical protein